MASDTMHPVTQRLYEAVKLLTRATGMPPATHVANEANVSLQTLTNWHDRGPSAQGLLEFQLAHGVNATWLLTGNGPQLIGTSRVVKAAEREAGYARWPFSAEILEVLGRLDADARRKIENGIRGQLDLPALPPLVGSPRKAAGGSSANRKAIEK